MKNAIAKIIIPALLLPSCLAYGGKGDCKLFKLQKKEGALISSTFSNYVEEDARLSLEKDNIFNATPAAFPSSLNAELYRDESWKETYLVHQDKVFRLGSGSAGNGAFNFALANIAGAYTLYFVYSYVDGMYSSSVAAFDFASSSLRAIDFPKEQDFQGTASMRDMQFALSDKGGLDLYTVLPDYQETGKETLEVLLQKDLGELKISTSAPKEIEPRELSFKASYDYGFHRQEKATLLWGWNLPFFNPKDYGQEKLIAGDKISVSFLGEMLILQSYPGQVAGNYYLVDVSFELASVVELIVKDAKEREEYDYGFMTNKNKYVINEDLSFIELDSLSDEDVVYASFSKEAPDKISALYSYKPR